MVRDSCSTAVQQLKGLSVCFRERGGKKVLNKHIPWSRKHERELRVLQRNANAELM